jgi:DNA-binding LacI/PurR family transcriptional regulator
MKNMEGMILNTPKYERLKQIIKNNIRDGIWRPGEKIPVENALCEQFEVSKITVQKAKRELIAEGVLENLPGRKGAFVKKIASIPSTGFIGVTVDDIQDPFVVDMLKGIEDKLWENKLHTILCNASFNVEKVEAYFQSLLERDVAGVIFTPVKGAGYRENNLRIMDMLTGKHIPHVLLDRYIPDYLVNSVVSDNRQSSKQLTKHLLEKGHTRILVLAGMGCSSIDERLQGHLQAFQEAGLEHDASLIIAVNDILLFQPPEQYQPELERVRRLVERAGDFTACYTMNPLLQRAIPAICPSIKEAKKPLEIVTYDAATNHLSGITSGAIIVKQPAYRMGWEAARLLIDTLHNPDQPIIQMTLQSEIIERAIECA